MFEGFSPETADFLWGIRMNNNREWFIAHKEDYLRYLYEPMKEMAKVISEPFARIPSMVSKTSRIYRDMRLAPETPYKESLWTCIRRDCEWWMREPCLFFEITPDGCSFGFLFWAPTAAVMNAIRADLNEHPGPFLRMVRSVRRKTKLDLTGNPYAKAKPCPNKDLLPYFSVRNLTAIRTLPFGEEMFHPEFAVTVRETLRGLYPFVEYCQKFTQTE